MCAQCDQREADARRQDRAFRWFIITCICSLGGAFFIAQAAWCMVRAILHDDPSISNWRPILLAGGLNVLAWYALLASRSEAPELWRRQK